MIVRTTKTLQFIGSWFYVLVCTYDIYLFMRNNWIVVLKNKRHKEKVTRGVAFCFLWNTHELAHCFEKVSLKFKYSEKATIFCKISTIDLSYVATVKSKVEILKNVEAFSEHMNCTYIWSKNNLILFYMHLLFVLMT